MLSARALRRRETAIPRAAAAASRGGNSLESHARFVFSEPLLTHITEPSGGFGGSIPAWGAGEGAPSLASLSRAPQYALSAAYERPFPLVRLRGLPFSAEATDVYEFFQGLSPVDVLMLRRDGRSTGEAYVVFGNNVHVRRAACSHACAWPPSATGATAAASAFQH